MAIVVWLGFLAFVCLFVALDLGVFHREDRVVGAREALAWTAAWIVLALAFNVFVYFLYDRNWFQWAAELSGRDAAVQFFIGYLVEKSLSVDNLFVIAMIFAYFHVPLALQHRVLFWGVLGALFLRGVMIALGAILIARFDWVVYVFGAFLIVTAAKMLVVRHDTIEPDRNLVVRLVRRLLPVTGTFEGHHFFVRRSGRWAVTPLFLALIMVETSDVIFAVDSIPAIFAITRDPFLVFTSNVFAILGLRSLYFALAALMDRFRYLKMSLVFILAYVGVKMILSHHLPIPNLVSLAVIGGMLAVGVLASLARGGADTVPLASPLAEDRPEEPP